MPSDKSNWQKLIGWLGPVLLASLGLHVLLLLLPLPDPKPPEEAEVELPEPILVTELPKLNIPESFPAEPPAAFIPEPAPVIEEMPLPVPIPEPVVVPPQVVELPPDPPEPPTPPESEAQQPDPPETPDPPDPPDPQNPPVGATPQPYNAKGTSSRDLRDASTEFQIAYGVLTPVSYLLDLGYPAGGECFDRGEFVEAITGISVNDLGNIEAARLLKTTGYPTIDSWLMSFFSSSNDVDLPPEVFQELQGQNSSAPPDGTITDWLQYSRDNQNEPLTGSANSKAYTFTISVTVEDNQCTPPVP